MTSSLPEPIFDAIQDLLEGPPEALDAGLDSLCLAHPDHATAIRAWVDECRKPAAADAPRPVDLDPDPLTIPLLQRVPIVRGVKVLGPAALYRTIAKGGMGCVFRARHVRLDHDVAVKCMQPDLAERSDTAFERFEREARVGARLSSENIVHVSDCGVAHGLHYIVMEWVDGEDLAQRVRRLGPRDAEETATLLIGMARGLADIHGSGILHRDIKPQNVLLSRQGVVKIADLGIASLAGEALTRSNEYLGTLGYMAPEQWDPTATVGPPADVYALGLTAFFLLQGQHAVNRPTDDVPRLTTLRPDLPAGLAQLVDRCTRHAPDERFADGGALLDALRALGLGSADGRLGRQATQLVDAGADPATTNLDLDALRRDLESDAGDAATLVSPPRPQPEPRASERRGSRVGIAVAAAAAVALGLSLWSLLGDAGDAPDDQKATAAGAPDRRRAAEPDPDGEDSSRSAGAGGTARAIDGDRAIEAPGREPLPVQPAVLTVEPATFDAAPSLAEGAVWTWGKPLDFGAATDLEFEVHAENCDHLTLTYWDAEAADKRPGSVVPVQTVANRRSFRVSLPAVEPNRYELELAAVDEAGGARARWSIQLVVPCTMPPIEGFERVRAGVPVGSCPRIDRPHYVTGSVPGASTPIPRLHFAMLERENPGDPIVLVGMTELPWAAYRTFLEAEGAFERFVDQPGDDTRRRQELLERTTPVDHPANSLSVEEAHGFALWLAQSLGRPVRLIDEATWQSAALQNGGHGRGFDGAELMPFFDRDEINYWPADAQDIVNPEVADVNAARPGAKGLWSVYRGRQGALPLFNIAGNAAEICVGDTDPETGAPIGGRILGGHYLSSRPDDLRIGRPGEGKPWTLEATDLRQSAYGYRLAITIED